MHKKEKAAKVVQNKAILQRHVMSKCTQPKNPIISNLYSATSRRPITRRYEKSICITKVPWKHTKEFQDIYSYKCGPESMAKIKKVN